MGDKKCVSETIIRNLPEIKNIEHLTEDCSICLEELKCNEIPV